MPLTEKQLVMSSRYDTNELLLNIKIAKKKVNHERGSLLSYSSVFIIFWTA